MRRARNWIASLFRPARPARASAARRYRPRLECLEDRMAPATHVWSGATSSLMSLDSNWASGGHPVNGEVGPIVLVFPNTAIRFAVTDDLDGLNVDQIQFTGAASNYLISGAAGGVTLNLTGTVGSQPNIDDQVGSNTFSATNLSLTFPATNQINVTAGSLTILSPVGGPGGLTKLGNGTLVLAGSNTYQGVTVLTQGITTAVNNTALGDVTQGTIVVNGATLQVQGNIHIGAETLQLTGLGVPGLIDAAGNPLGALYSFGGQNSLAGSITLNSIPAATDVGINVASNGGPAGSGVLTFSGDVTGGANLRKFGDGTLELAGTTTNTTSGNVEVDAGTLLLNKVNAPNVFAIGNLGNNTLTIGDNIGGPDSDIVRFGAGGQLDPTRTSIVINESGLLDLNNQNGTVGALTLRGGDVTTGTGTLTLTQDIIVQTPPVPRTATITGKLSLGANSRTFTITKDPALNGGNGPELAINAVISQPSGPGEGITKSGTGTLLLGAVNTYMGATIINGGTLRVGVDNALPSTGAVGLSNSGSTLDLNNFNNTIGSLTGTAGTNLTLGTGVLTTGGSSTGSTTFSGTVTGGSTSGITKVGTGTFQLAGNSPSYTGTTTVNAGTLQVNNGVNFSNSKFIVNAATFTANGLAGNTTVNANGTLGGIGNVAIATINSGGLLSPGGTGQIGTLAISGGANALTQSIGSTFLEEINSAASFDKVNVTGSASLGNSTLQVGLAQAVPVGTVFTILQTSAGVSGIFNGLPDGTTFVINNQNFTIRYNQGGNNAVTLTAGQLAPPVTLESIQNGSATTTPSFGVPTTFTFTIQRPAGDPAPTGTVTFLVDGTPRGPVGGVSLNAMGQASISVPADVTYAQFQGGPHTIVANYSGDASYAPRSPTLTETVQRAITSTAPSGSPNPIQFGQSTTLTALVTGTTPAGPVDPTAPKPTGLVDFFDTTTNTDLGTAPVDATGNATLPPTATFTGGPNIIRADYLGQASPIGPGDQNYTPTAAGSGSGTFTLTVNADSTNTSVITDHPGGVTFGQPVTFTATVTNTQAGLGSVIPQGSVTFVETTTGITLGSKNLDPSGHASLTVNNVVPGSRTIQATFTANPSFAGSSGTTSQTVIQTPSVSVAFGPVGQVLEVVNSAGILTQFDMFGAHTVGGGILSASVAFGPAGQVLLITFQNGELFQFDATGGHRLGAGVLSASVAFGPAGEVLSITFQDGELFQFDASGQHRLTANVRSASVAFTPGGSEVLLVVTSNGGLLQCDAGGTHVLASSGVVSAGFAFDSTGAAVTDMIFSDGELFQFDRFGAHKLGTIS